MRCVSWPTPFASPRTSDVVAKRPEPPEKTGGFKARRWVVERTHSWMNRFRRILIRWEKRPDTYLAMLHLACALITWKACGLLG